MKSIVISLLVAAVCVARDPLCPYPSNETTFFPDFNNCSNFFQCFEGIKYVMHCPNGSYWNEPIKACDYKCGRTIQDSKEQNADPEVICGKESALFQIKKKTILLDFPCNRSCTETFIHESPDQWRWEISVIGLTTVKTTKDPEPETLQKFISDFGISTTTELSICSGVADGTFLSNPNNCRAYYECVFGKPVSYVCSQGTYWNETLLSCVNGDC